MYDTQQGFYARLHSRNVGVQQAGSAWPACQTHSDQAPAACSEAVEVRREMAGGVAAPRCPVSSPMLPLPALASRPSSPGLRDAI